MGKDLVTVVYYKKAAGVILQAVPLFTPCVGVCTYADDFCCNMFMHQEKPKFSSIAACLFDTSFTDFYFQYYAMLMANHAPLQIRSTLIIISFACILFINQLPALNHWHFINRICHSVSHSITSIRYSWE